MTIIQNFLLEKKKPELDGFFFQSDAVPFLEGEKLVFKTQSTGESIISFDGIANALPIETFYRHTTVKNVRCRASVIGETAVLGILHYTRQGDSRIVEESPLLSPEQDWESSWLPLDLNEGRYALFIRFKSQIRILRAAWIGDTIPDNNSKFLVFIPAFKRNDSVNLILSDFCNYAPLKKFDSLFLVIDQGQTLSRNILPPDQRIRFISQMNFGPTGGFMRAYLYAKELGFQFILTADDDILVFPEMFYRLMVLQSLSIRPLILGTMMMTIQEPTVVSEQGARFEPNKVRFAKAINRNTKTLSNKERTILYCETPCDYTAWWLSCSPVSSLSVLPPYFMRGDDVYQGIMAGKKGFMTIVPPHCFVWHEAFSFKASPTRAYLSFRNDLANRFLSGGPSVPVLTAWSILKLILACIANFDYDLATVYIQALEQFIHQPEWIKDPLIQTKMVLSRIKQEPATENLTVHLSKTFGTERKRSLDLPFRILRRFLYILTGANYLNPFARTTARDGGIVFRYHGDFQGWGYLGYKKVAVVSPDGNGYICQRSWKRMIQTSIKAIALIFEFLLLQSRLKREYRASNMQEESWKKAFSTTSSIE